MDTDDFEYELPAERIAQSPWEPRDGARLLVDRGAASPPQHRTVADLADLVQPGDLLVVNDTRVRPARLRLHKPTGGAVEVLLLEPLVAPAPTGGRPEGNWWEALVKPSRKVPDKTVLRSADGTVALEVGEPLGDGRRAVRIASGDPDAVGEVPLPPYIHAPLADPERYQTVFARRPASAAAPTAGLHLTDAVLARCAEAGASVATVELVVGLDTFRPITARRVEDHPMHTEAYVVPDDTVAAVREARRVIAVGTTSVRALESWAATGARSGRTDLFIRRGFPFQVVDLLLTNFHVPRTTLLAMIDAFVGPRWRDLYEVALAERYRFLSFGDAMLLQRAIPSDPARPKGEPHGGAPGPADAGPAAPPEDAGPDAIPQEEL